jgi:hypothetical protein
MMNINVFLQDKYPFRLPLFRKDAELEHSAQTELAKVTVVRPFGAPAAVPEPAKRQ